MKKRLFTLFISIVVLFIFIQVQSKDESTSINEEIIYDIFIDRFRNGNHELSEQVDLNDLMTYKGRDVVEIKKNLDDLVQYGFTTISISSIFSNAPKGYHGYWIEDF